MTRSTTSGRSQRSIVNTVPARRPPRPPPQPAEPSYPHLVVSAALGSRPTGFVPVVSWHAQTATWIARATAGVALLSFDQRRLELRFHSGTSDAGATGWRFGPSVDASELTHLVAAFNGGFKFSTGAGGFMSYGRVAVPLQDGLDRSSPTPMEPPISAPGIRRCPHPDAQSFPSARISRR